MNLSHNHPEKHYQITPVCLWGLSTYEYSFSSAPLPLPRGQWSSRSRHAKHAYCTSPSYLHSQQGNRGRVVFLAAGHLEQTVEHGASELGERVLSRAQRHALSDGHDLDGKREERFVVVTGERQYNEIERERERERVASLGQLELGPKNACLQ